MNKQKNRQMLKDDFLIQQNGKCPLCTKGAFCATCGIEVSNNDIEIIGKGKCRHFHKGYPGHHIQMVNTLDHNHSHKGCSGCEICVRGVTHDRCNRALNLLFEGKTADQINYIIEYTQKGSQAK